MQTGEYREFAGPFPGWVRHLAVTWRWPLLISVLLHALVFWPAALRDAPSAEAGVAAVTTVRAKLLPRPVSLPQATSSPESAVQRASTPHPAYPLVRSVSRPNPAPVEEAEIPQSAVMQATVGLDSAAVRTYRITLARLLAGGALRTRLTEDMQGTLEVGIAITPHGLIRQVEIVRSSGQSLLDTQVVAAVRAAAQEAVIPGSMRGQAFVILLPVEVGPVTSAAVR